MSNLKIILKAAYCDWHEYKLDKGLKSIILLISYIMEMLIPFKLATCKI